MMAMRRPWRNPVKCRRTDGRVEALSTGSQRTPQSEGQTKKTSGKSQQRRVTMDPRPRTTRTAESSNRGEAGLQEGETPSFAPRSPGNLQSNFQNSRFNFKRLHINRAIVYNERTVGNITQQSVAQIQKAGACDHSTARALNSLG